MNLDEATFSLEALPGVYEVNLFVVRDDLDAMLEYVRFSVHCASPEILPEETRQGILRIQETLERGLGCFVSFVVSAGLRMPDGASG